MTVDARRDASRSGLPASWVRREVEIHGNSGTAVRGLLSDGPDAAVFLTLAHGAGAPMTHRFMESLAGALAGERIATLRYNFPYADRGRRRPDPPSVLVATVGDAIASARRYAEERPLYAGGKSMGGRMTSMRVAQERDEGVRGIVFFGFPFHPPDRPDTARSIHLKDVRVPMLFHQGTRDRLADPHVLRSALRPVSRYTSLNVIDGPNHAFVPPKGAKLTPEDVLANLARHTVDWISEIERIGLLEMLDARG